LNLRKKFTSNDTEKNIHGNLSGLKSQKKSINKFKSNYLYSFIDQIEKDANRFFIAFMPIFH